MISERAIASCRKTVSEWEITVEVVHFLFFVDIYRNNSLYTATNMEESPHSFNTGKRVCCGCFALKGRSEFLKCSVCKVFVYCSKECQRVGWKELSHRKTCKPFTQTEPKEGLPCEPEDGEDLDKPYAFVVIS